MFPDRKGNSAILKIPGVFLELSLSPLEFCVWCAGFKVRDILMTKKCCCLQCLGVLASKIE